MGKATDFDATPRGLQGRLGGRQCDALVLVSHARRGLAAVCSWQRPLRDGSDEGMLGVLRFFHPWSWLPMDPEQLTLQRIA